MGICGRDSAHLSCLPTRCCSYSSERRLAWPLWDQALSTAVWWLYLEYWES